MGCDLCTFRTRVGLYHSRAALHGCDMRLTGYCCVVTFLILRCCISSKLLYISLLLFFLAQDRRCTCCNCSISVHTCKNVFYNTDQIQHHASSGILGNGSKAASSPFLSPTHLNKVSKVHLMTSGDVENNPGPCNSREDLCVAHINTQSVRYKIDLIEAESKKFDIITMSETWLCDSDCNNSLLLSTYNPPIRKDRVNDPHGGVAIYVRNTLSCKHRLDLDLPGLECVWIETKLNQESLLVGSLYRPPNSNAHYWELIRENIRKVNNTGLKYLLLGDFNTNWINQPSHHLLNIINDFQLKQYITEPTRVTDTSNSCIDLIMTQSEYLITHVEVLPEICSDHRVPTCYIKTKKLQNHKFKRTIYNYKNIDQDKFRNLIQNTDWNNIMQTDDVDVGAQNFTETFFNISKQCMPSKQITVRENDAPWINNEIRFLIAEKNKVHKSAKHLNTIESWVKFREIRNRLTSKIRERKQEYTKELDIRASNPDSFGTKEWWKLVNTFLSKKGIYTNEIPPIELNGKVYYSNKEKAEIFNSFFISQAKLENDNDPIPDIEVSNGPVLSTIELSEHDVNSAINNLNTNKAVGPDMIHNYLLKAASPHITELITQFFNKCISKGKFPASWKKAHVTPIFKKGSKESPSNYRPISLLSCIGKLFETCIHKYVLQFLNENNIITQSQSGFMHGDSTTYQLLSIYDNLCSSFDQELTTQAVYLDVTKAFDRVWHRGLLAKLNAIGVRGQLLVWFQDYLNNRKQATVIKSETSEFKTVCAGVPQGSVLGPLLFLIYINDIVDNIESVIKLFADDTSLSLGLANPDLRAIILNRDLNRILSWGNRWKVTFNATKTEVVNFIQGNGRCDNLTFGNVQLDNTDNHKHLGLTIQSNLKWDSHINAIASKVTMLLSCLNSFKYRLGRKALETMYKSFILPHFDYADIIWDSCSDTLANKLEELHLHALRIITGLVRGTSHDKLYEESGFNSLKERRRRHKLIAFKKFTLGLCPDYLMELLPRLVSETNPYPRRKPFDRTIPNCRTETYRKSFFPSTTLIWNQLPTSLQNSTSIQEFKKSLTTFDSPVPAYYYVGERKEQIIHCRLRLGMSDLNEHMYNRHLQLNRACACGRSNETTSHYLLHCSLYTEERRNTISNIHTNYINLQTLLVGNPLIDFEENKHIFLTVQEFIRQSQRFV